MKKSLRISRANHYQRLGRAVRSMMRLLVPRARQSEALRLATLLGHHSYRRLETLTTRALATATLRALIWTILQVWTIQIRTERMMTWATPR